MSEPQSTGKQETFSGTQEVLEQHKVDEKVLATYLADCVEGFEGPLSVREFKGGQSNPTYQLITPNKKYVLRRKPPGKLLPSAHAVDREYKVITALGTVGYPVPKTYAMCEDESILGTMFYVMDMVEGRILWEPLLPGYTPERRHAIYKAKNKAIAQLHMVDYEAIGLGDFGKPGNYFARQISRWSKQYVASETESIPEMDKLMDWLPNNIPDDDATSIVHGDYRMDNMVLHPTEDRVLAVLDWELSTLGHPLGDFTYHMMQWVLPSGGKTAGTSSLAEANLAELGIPSLEEYVAMYCEQTGRKGIDNVDYYFAYNLFRLGGILQGIIGRVRDGTAASEHATDTASQVRPLAELGWYYAQRAGAV